MPAPLAIYFATMTGNAERLAGKAAERAERDGWSATQKNLCHVHASELTEQPLALFIVSTWGDGEPPGDAQDFHDQLFAANAAPLPNLRYAVFGLGDRDYPEFNAFARKLDERLADLGAHRQHDRIEADLRFDEPYEQWENSVFDVLAALKPATA